MRRPAITEIVLRMNLDPRRATQGVFGIEDCVIMLRLQADTRPQGRREEPRAVDAIMSIRKS